jgi:hypothetical protein
MAQNQHFGNDHRNPEQRHPSDTEDSRARHMDVNYQASSQTHRPQQGEHQGQQGGYSNHPDHRGQQGQYGMSPGNEYGNSPTNPYAKNANGSPGTGEPWRDEPYGLDPHYGPDFQRVGYGNSEARSGQSQERGPYPGGQSQYAGGVYQGYREQGGYPVGNYQQGSENYRGPGFQGGGGIHQAPYESAHGYGHEQGERWEQSNQIGQRSRGNSGQHDEDHSAEFDPHYRQWRSEQIRQLDDDYRKWRAEYYERFSTEFNEWRRSRLEQEQRKPVEGKGNLAQGKQGTEQSGGAQNKDK